MSFWLDEILLGRNIVGLPLGDLLTRPLYLDQVAPRGFLLAERAAVALLGDTELVQRLFPFLCAIAGVFLFRRLAERMLDGWAVPFAVALYAVAIPLIRYSAEVKQYAVDATAAILLLLLALDLRERDSSAGRLAVAGVIGFLLPWVSQAAVIVMAGIGAALALRWLTARDPRDRRVLLGVMPVWALAAVIAIAVGRRSMSPSTAAFMDNFWKGGFFPLPFDAERAVHWVWDTALSPFTDPALLRYPLPFLFVLVALLGVAAMWGSRRDAALMLAGPFALALIAAVVQQYPMRGRLMVYLLPGLLIAISAGAEWLRRAAGRLHPAAGAVLMLALLVPPAAALVKVPPPYELEPHRPDAALPAAATPARRRHSCLSALPDRTALLWTTLWSSAGGVEDVDLPPHGHARLRARCGPVSRGSAAVADLGGREAVPHRAARGAAVLEHHRHEARLARLAVAAVRLRVPRALRPE